MSFEKIVPHPAFCTVAAMHAACDLCVTIPVRNEEVHLWAALDALREQRSPHGVRVGYERYEVLLLLNHCTDRTAELARSFQKSHPEVRLHVAHWDFPEADAHVGSARSLLMNEAAARLTKNRHPTSRSEARPKILLTTDADTVVDAYWLHETLQAVGRGADAVGGDILTRPKERETLPERAHFAYALNRRYREAVALLESLLDPVPYDPWPRHFHHFGASLACTLEAYRRCGGMMPVATLEDLAFYNALMRTGARFRHEPRVKVFTSARTEGRVRIGLSEQLRQWERGDVLTVRSTEFLEERFRCRALLRAAFDETSDFSALASRLGRKPRELYAIAWQQEHSVDAAWTAIDGDTLVLARMPRTMHEGTMQEELRKVQRLTERLGRCDEEDPCDTSRDGAEPAMSTIAG